MKKLILMVSVACVSLYISAESFTAQYNDFKQADQCIASLVAEGVERGQIVVNGAVCYVK